MKKILAFALFSVFVGNAWIAEAAAGHGMYISFRAGGGEFYDPAWGVSANGGLALGAAFGRRFKLADELAVRTETEIGYGTFGRKIGSVELDQRTISFMGNIYFDFLTSYKVKPYVGFGAGMLNLRDKWSDITIEFNSTEFAYGLYGGIGFNLTASGSVMGDVGIRHINSTSYGASISMTTVNAGARFMF